MTHPAGHQPNGVVTSTVWQVFGVGGGTLATVSKHASKGQIIGRRWKYAPPPWRMYEALTDELDRWLPFAAGETRPKVDQASCRPSSVVFRPWIDKTIRQVEVEITSDGSSGSSMRVLATAKTHLLSDEERRRVRYRLGTIFGLALRKWVDEPHR
jgi:hypothetical protein